ncbi:MAG: class I SAM-dependent methyltransferase [Lachnospiraceae bacterium]|nr:class I SAM-dependent methyltransferase [Lachnospiraceae bacterium]
MFYRELELFYEPERECQKITKGNSKSFSEMTIFQQAFLCGLIKEKRPKKILEIGVAAGGTTAVILSCIKQLGYKAEMYSVDLEEKWYRTGKRETGFVAKEYMDILRGNVQHKFLLGRPIPCVVDEVGEQIDFLILDTTHSIPGELLDFLVCLPYLKNGGVVILHDVIENHITCRDHEIATKLLFDLVQGEKWYMCEDESAVSGFSNIAAFEVDKRTRDTVYNLFSALSFSWTYMPEEWELEEYIKIIRKKYETEYVKLLERMIRLQTCTEIRKKVNAHYNMDQEILKLKWEKQKNVFLYGGGYWARIYSSYAKINQLPVSGWVISDDQDMVATDEESLPVYRLKDIPYAPEECSFILALDPKHFAQIRRSLKSRGYYMIL